MNILKALQHYTCVAADAILERIHSDGCKLEFDNGFVLVDSAGEFLQPVSKTVYEEIVRRRSAELQYMMEGVAQ